MKPLPLLVASLLLVSLPAWAEQVPAVNGQPAANAPNPKTSKQNPPPTNATSSTNLPEQPAATEGGKAPGAKPAPGAKNPPPNAAQPPVAANSSAPATSSTPPLAQPVTRNDVKFDDYLGELASTLKLSREEQTDIATYYEADGPLLRNILNNPSLSPLVQAEQVSDVRDARNAKIDALLDDPARVGAFHALEAKYRVALTVLAADGGLVPAGQLAPVTTPGSTLPGDAEKAPNAKGAAK